MLHPLLLLLLLLFFILVIFVSFFSSSLFPRSFRTASSLLHTWRIMIRPVRLLLREILVYEIGCPRDLFGSRLFFIPPSFFSFLFPPSARSSSAQRIAFQYYGFFLSKQKSLPFGPLFFYQFFTPCRLSRWSLDWDPPMNSGRILIDVNQKS